jgi:replicative DNA helicase
MREQPRDEQAERSVLGSILVDKEAIIKVAEFLRPNHFYNEDHGRIYEVMLDLYQEREPIDLVTLTRKLKKKRWLTKVGGASYVSELIETVPTAANVEHYGQIVRDLAVKRRLITLGGELAEMGFDESKEAGAVLDEVEQKVFAISQQHLKKVFISIKDALAESFDRLDELYKSGSGLRGVPTGFKDLDNVLAGMQPSNLLILAARPGVGKTALALNIARNVTVKSKRGVGMFSLEMSQEELVDRLLVSQADIDAWKYKTGKLSNEDFNSLSEAMGILAEAPLFIDDTPGLSVMEMRTKARRLKADQEIDLIIVDYLQLMKSRNLENRVQEVGEISMALKELARELKVPVLALSQLSRAVEHRGGNRPQLADLRESGSIEQDADVVMFLYREEEEEGGKREKQAMRVLDIQKHRNGALRAINLFFRGDRISFYEMEKGK